MSYDKDELLHYRDKMEWPMEHLAHVLNTLGVIPADGGIDDWELVDIAIEKLEMLHRLVLAGGFNVEQLKAVMKK